MKKIIEKQILRYGQWKHPNAKDGKLNITKEYVQHIVDNFKHTPYAPVLRGHIDNNEAEKDPTLIISKNIQTLKADDKGLNATFEVEDADLEKYNDVSVSIDEAYENHETGNIIGPTLKHIAMVVDPYMKGLNPFIALEDHSNYLINLSDITMDDKEKSQAELDAEATKAKEEADAKAEADKKATEETKESDEVKDKPEEDKSTEDKGETDKVETPEKTVDSAELQKQIKDLNLQLAEKNAKIAEGDAHAKYVELRDAGKATPAMEESVTKLFQSANTVINLADGSKPTTGELLNEMFNKMPVLVSFGEKGTNTETVNTSDEPLKVELKELWKTQNPSLTDEQLEDKYIKNTKHIKKAIADKS